MNKISTSPRKAELLCLNLHSGKILKTISEKVFVVKEAGLADLTVEIQKEYARRAFPGDHDPDEFKDDLILDFENFFCMMEDSFRTQLEKIILGETKITIEDKTYLCFFIVFQLMRNPHILNKQIEMFKNFGWHKFELFLTIKRQMSDRKQMMQYVMPFVVPNWTFYRTKKHFFPLTDKPIIINGKDVVITLAPNLILSFSLNPNSVDVGKCTVKTFVPYFKSQKFRNLIIKNAEREIVFNDLQTLQEIRKRKMNGY